MNCTICRHGDTKPGHATVMLERGDTTVIIKAVPADVCENCGEYYLSGQMTGQVIAMGDDAVRRGAEVEIIRFAAWRRRGRFREKTEDFT